MTLLILLVRRNKCLIVIINSYMHVRCNTDSHAS